MPKIVFSLSRRLKISESKLSERNPNWKGDSAGLDAIHIWVLYRKPKQERCEECKNNEPKDLANISQKYRRDINDFRWLCRRCHMKGDGRLDKFISFASKRLLKKISCLQCKIAFQPVCKKTRYCSLSCASTSTNLRRWHGVSNNDKLSP